MCIIYLKKEAYVIDRKAFYLLCRLQEVKFGYEDMDDYDRDVEKLKMFKLILAWLIDQKRAIKFDGKPHHLVIQFKDD